MKNKNNALDHDRLGATDLEDRIGAEQVRAAYSNTAVGMSATAVAALLVGGILPASARSAGPSPSASARSCFCRSTRACC
jgi:hypothetical protein